MKLPSFEYLLPESIREACKIAAAEGDNARVIAGGTDILMAMKFGLKRPGKLIDISRIPHLDRISYSNEKGLSVGSLATLRHLAAHRAVKEKYPLLVQAALSVGSVQLQSMGTTGGNLCQDTRCLYYNRPLVSRQRLGSCFKTGGEVCHVVKGSKSCWATYAGDMAPALLALRARITVSDSEGEQTLPLADIYSGRGENPNGLKPGQIVTEIQIPAPRGEIGIYLKLSARKAIDFPLLGVAINLLYDSRKRNIKDIDLALTAMDKSPVMVPIPEGTAEIADLEKQMDRLADAAYKAAHPVDNAAGYSPRYRREMVRISVRRGILRTVEAFTRKEEHS